MDLPPGPSGLNVVPEYNSDDEPNLEGLDPDHVTYNSDDGEDDDPDYAANPPRWSQHNTRGFRDIPFTKEEGFLVPLPVDKTPIGFFDLLVDNIFLENIVDATNAYALEFFCGPNTTPGSRITRWKDLTVYESRIFLALVIHMGIVQYHRVQDYWKVNKLFISCFPKFMSRDRFLIILRCIHFDPKPDHSNRLTKVQLLIDYFNNKMKTVYYPQKKLCIDEAMVLWRGRLLFRQYIKGKRHKYGIKLYSLCDPHGLILKFMVYCGVLEDMGANSHAGNVVMKLMQGKLNCGHTLYMDNYYNSFSLASLLLRKGTYCTGTLRLDRKYISPTVKSKNLKKGETIAEYADGVVVGKWKDKRIVSYISTEFANEMVTSLNRVNLERTKPLPIVQYNHFMKGVDRADQMLSYYPCERKTLRWYKKIFVHVLQMLLSNAHYLYNEMRTASGQNKMQLYDFRVAIADSLLPNVPPPPRPLKRKSVPHVPTRITEKAKCGKRVKHKRCRECSKKKINKKVVWHCTECEDQPGLCVPKCFDDWHN